MSLRFHKRDTFFSLMQSYRLLSQAVEDLCGQKMGARTYELLMVELETNITKKVLALDQQVTGACVSQDCKVNSTHLLPSSQSLHPHIPSCRFIIFCHVLKWIQAECGLAQLFAAGGLGVVRSHGPAEHHPEHFSLPRQVPHTTMYLLLFRTYLGCTYYRGFICG